MSLSQYTPVKQTLERITMETGLDPSHPDPEWIKCPKCHEDLKSKNLMLHLEKVHQKRILKKKNGKSILLFSIPIFVVFIIVLSILGYTFLIQDNNENEEEEIIDITPGWLDTYRPQEKVGTSNDDWWILFPTQNPSWGEIPNHPTWLIDMLKNGSILVFLHSTNCLPCVEQQDSVDHVMDAFGDEIQLLDLISGIDEEANELIEFYDANGPPGYIPTTIILTIVKDSMGNSVVGWHSIEGATGDSWLTFRVMDAIYFHHEYIDDWG
jgi:hypothetical protein